ncbi:MAG TPA: DUF4282 domain-containing protein [Thiomicrospira sp.]|jgi:hypothetical protein|nr:DUF4282 domain-containing protein [Thiomicrospira sp.]
MDFLTFKTFISTDVLIAFYYLGAVILPITLWFFLIWASKKYQILGTIYETGQSLFWRSLTTKQQVGIILMFTAAFFFMQLFWRMMFEFLIAYMQIRDALVAEHLG